MHLLLGASNVVVVASSAILTTSGYSTHVVAIAPMAVAAAVRTTPINTHIEGERKIERGHVASCKA